MDEESEPESRTRGSRMDEESEPESRTHRSTMDEESEPESRTDGSIIDEESEPELRMPRSKTDDESGSDNGSSVWAIDTWTVFPEAAFTFPDMESGCIADLAGTQEPLEDAGAYARPAASPPEKIWTIYQKKSVVDNPAMQLFFSDLKTKLEELEELHKVLEADTAEKEAKLDHLQERVDHETEVRLRTLKENVKTRDFLVACVEGDVIERTEKEIDELETELEQIRQKMSTCDADHLEYLERKEKELDELYEFKRSEARRQLLERIQQLRDGDVEERESFEQRRTATSEKFSGIISQLKATLSALDQEAEELKTDVKELEEQQQQLKTMAEDYARAKKKERDRILSLAKKPSFHSL